MVSRYELTHDQSGQYHVRGLRECRDPRLALAIVQS
jgi:hypothetical protein